MIQSAITPRTIQNTLRRDVPDFGVAWAVCEGGTGWDTAGPGSEAGLNGGGGAPPGRVVEAAEDPLGVLPTLALLALFPLC